MSNKEGMSGKHGDGRPLVPRLRFPEYRTEVEWTKTKICDAAIYGSSTLAQGKLQITSDGYPVFGADGIVGYIDRFDQQEDYIAIVKDGSGSGRLTFMKGESSVLSTLGYLRPKSTTRTETLWLFYCLLSLNLRSHIKGSGIPHLYFSDYGKEEIGVPAPGEQQKIAECLSSIDDLITLEAQKLGALKTHKKGLMQQLFPAEGETVPRLRFSEFREAGEWEQKSLGQAAKYENGKAHEQDIVKLGKFTVVNSKFVSTDGQIKKFTNAAFCIAEKEDILMVLSDIPNGKSIAKCFFVKTNNLYTVNQRICKITTRNTSSIFLFYVLNRNSYFLSFDDGIKQTNLKKDDVLNCPIILPKDFKEQQEIADCLASLDDLITAQTQKVEELKTHKKGLMQQLFPTLNEVSA
jgi:type I restriction enzyme S subunit